LGAMSIENSEGTGYGTGEWVVQFLSGNLNCRYVGRIVEGRREGVL